jgi:geranylgeranyl reductase
VEAGLSFGDMTERVDVLGIGAGPGGLRAAEVLAAAGREVLVLEKNDEIGPKVCAGGLTPKAQAIVDALELPAGEGLVRQGQAVFSSGKPFIPSDERCLIRTVPRPTLGRHQALRTRRAGAEIRTGTAATRLDLAARTVQAGGRRISFATLIGADGSDSSVRRAAGLVSPRAYFACEYNVPGLRLEPLRVECDALTLAAGYFWVFPHACYTSIGCGAPKRQVPPRTLHAILDQRMQGLGLERSSVPFEGACIEVDYRGIEAAPGVYLVGDAAGLASPLTAEGIYPALVSGEEVARRVLEPGYPMPRLRSWLRVKRRHHRIAALLAPLPLRRLFLALLSAAAASRLTRGAVADLFVSA